MFDCSDDVRAYHDNEVRLSQKEQDNMRDRRNANRKRLRDGLAKKEKPSPLEFVKQGSYAMKTMVCDPSNDYDIDDGVYFKKEDLVGDRGAEMSSLQARQMVRDALDDGSFKTPPEVRNNCVRVYYEAGYHVDVPVYRRVATKDVWGNVTYHYELGASSGWKRSDARNVTEWFEDERSKSSDKTQLRRVVREIKKYSKSRDSWGGCILSGFGITKLVIEKFAVNSNREDKALYDTMKAIRDRLDYDKSVKHPVTPGETITNETSANNYVDPKATFLRDKLNDAINNLAPLFDVDCTREKALKCWDKVFSTTFFSARYEPEAKAAASVAAPAVLSSGFWASQEAAAKDAVRKEGGGRHA
ncbi:cyclic GMP-AMP synthase DncV-like nucleotidyltransferase [Microvirga arabica]|uniref:Cyclic GMP-AMP synthase n=1 Tax=Microvirga arabica TaxID=1128671 RepID=A0ABV6YEM5_9HYPH